MTPHEGSGPTLTQSRHLDPWGELTGRIRGLLTRWDSDRPVGSEVTVALFGSVARGEAGLDSDVDLLVVVPQVDDRMRELTSDLAEHARRRTGQGAQVHLTSPDRLAEARRMRAMTAGDVRVRAATARTCLEVGDLVQG